MDVEAFFVGGAVGPRLDVARTEEGAIDDASDRAAAAPVVVERRAKDVLPDALPGEAPGLGGRVDGLCLFALNGQRGVGEARA